MDVEAWDVSFAWDDLFTASDAPKITVYKAELRLNAALHAVVESLARLAGKPKRRFGLFGKRVEWDQPPYRMTAQVRGDDVVIKAGNRLNPKSLQRVMGSLADAGGKHLRIIGEVHEFCAPGANLRACTPCQAGRIRRA